MKVHRKPMMSKSKSKKKNFKRSPEKVVQIEVSDEDQTSKPSVKRMSLKKKTQALFNESASKASINESIKEQECIKTPSSSQALKSSHGLRRTKRGRKPKKSHVYNSAENLIYSHEKEEEMIKLGDSEFKLPNEEKNKLKLEVSQSKTVLLHDQSESDQDINMSEDHTEERKALPLIHAMSFGPSKCQFPEIENSEDESMYNYKNKRMNATSFIDARRRTGSIRKTTKGHWTKEEDSLLRAAVLKYDAKNWKKIAECLVGRTDVQ